MIVETRKSAVLALFLLLFLPVVKAAAQSNTALPSAGQMTIWRARRIFTESGEFKLMRNSFKIERGSFRITPDNIEFDFVHAKSGARQHSSIDLKTLEPVSVTCKDHHGLFYCELLDEAGKRLSLDLPLGRVFYTGPWGGICFHVKDKNYSDCFAPTTYTGEVFAYAINRLRAFAMDSASPLRRNFAEQAAAWRALATKPEASEQVRLQRLLAEDAVKSRNPAIALFHYESGLEIDPTWPQGYFNAALVAAELGTYTQAVEHMRAYLELVPDAPDAQAARDQIAIWQFKAKETK